MAVQYFEPISDEGVSIVWGSVNKTIASGEEDVEIAKAWLNSQPHLPHKLSDNQIKCFLILAKGSMEKVKMKIDMYFTMRTLYPDIFFDSHPFSKRLLNASKFIYALPLPKYDKDFKRFLFFKLKDENPADMDAYALGALILNMADLRLLEDFCNDHLVIFDMEYCKIGHIAKLSPMLIKSIYNILGKSMTTKVAAIHFINAPSSVDQVVYLLKSVIKPKLASRIFVHKDMQSVVESIDKHIVPRDYGGYEDSLDELEGVDLSGVIPRVLPILPILILSEINEINGLVVLPKSNLMEFKISDRIFAKFFKKYEQYKDFFDQREHWIVNEDLRPSKTTNDEYLGYYGNFKKLDLD